MRVGIPRAMLFHHYGEDWLAFLEALGVEPVVSEATTGEIITAGAVHADNETCLPVKVFSGHLLWLREQVDAILVPRVISEQHGTCSCPKFMGLPDLARSLASDLPPVLAPRMDLGDWRYLWAHEWYSVARTLKAGRLDSASAVAGLVTGVRKHRVASKAQPQSGDLTVGVAGHLYNVHDSRVSLGLLDRISRMGANTVTVDQVQPHRARMHAATLSRKIFWGYESRLAGAALHWSRTRSVAGILFVTSFACGPGSMVGALLEDQLGREGSVPLMTITLDEHAAEAGMVTRLEAFIDMLRRSNRLKVASARQLAPDGVPGGGGE
jgi:predicted nucleotide-binding protein (sugar kinase/HSP70/actin superfamily)